MLTEFFLKKSNRNRHKVGKFCINVDSDAEYLQKVFKFYPFIWRETRTPINNRIQNLLGNHTEFELCDGARLIYFKK